MAVDLQSLAVSCMGTVVVEISIQCEQLDNIVLHTRGVSAVIAWSLASASLRPSLANSPHVAVECHIFWPLHVWPT